MSDIYYRRIDYASEDDKYQIVKLYKDIFNMDFADEYDFWFRINQRLKPLGVIAIYKSTGRVIGHFTTGLFEAKISNEITNFRMSMGFMTDADYRGKGIATILYKTLREEIILESDAAFIMGFPNDVSLKLHTEKMDYQMIRDYSFVVLPDKGCYAEFKKIKTLQELYYSNDEVGLNILNHEKNYLSWRFSKPNYRKYVSDKNRQFICTRYKNKMDILFWDKDITEEELLEFAGFLYNEYNVEKVTTWNSVSFLDKYQKEERSYHMCINFLNCDDKLLDQIKQNKWFFCMGDCELF